MKIKIISSTDSTTQVTITDSKLIINLSFRWPEIVDFDRKYNELIIQYDENSEKIRIKFSHPIEVDSKRMIIEKDQILLPYSKLL